MYGRNGFCFSQNFKRKEVTNKRYFTYLIAYIHNNAIHHGFAKNPEDWPCSSWHAYMQNRKTKIEKNTAMEWFGGKEGFLEIHQNSRPFDISFEF